MVNIQTLIYRIGHKAATTDDDVESNMLSALVERLNHNGALFEIALTEHEKNIITKFMHD